LSPALAFGVKAPKQLNDLINNNLFSSPASQAAKLMTGLNKSAPVLSAEEFVAELKNIDWSNTHPHMKTTLIAAAEEAAAINPEGFYAARELANSLSDIRKNAIADVDAEGNLRFRVKVSKEHPDMVSPPVSFMGMQAFIGKDGITLAKRIQDSPLLPNILGVESAIDYLADNINLDLGLITNNVFNIDIPETGISPIDAKVALKEWKNNVSESKYKSLLGDDSLNHTIKKHTDGNFTSIVFTAPLIQPKEGEIFAKINPKAKDSAADPRKAGIEQASELNLDATHLLTRSFAFGFQDVFPSHFDGNDNLDRASVGLNRYIQRHVEIGIKDELRDWVTTNPTKGLKAVWEVSTYSQDIDTYNKYGGLDKYLRRSTKEKAIMNLQATVSFLNPEGEVVKSWDWEIEDPHVLQLMQRSDVFKTIAQ